MSGNLSSCASAIRGAAPGLTDDDVEELLSAMIRRERAMPNRSGDALRWREIAQEMTAQELRAVRIEKHARQAQLLAQTGRDARWTGNDAVQHISDLIDTSQRAGKGRAYSAEAVRKDARREYLGAMMQGWQEAGALGRLRHLDPDTERALGNEIARLNGDTRITATDDAQIRASAEVVVTVQTAMRERMNALGAFIEPLEGRVTRTSHDSHRMRKAGADAWIDYVLPKLDDRTWVRAGVDPGDVPAARKWLGDVYANLVSGNHNVVPSAAVDPLARAYGGGSLARAVSEDRILHWKTADIAIAYNREFGRSDLMGGLIGEVEHGARAIGLMTIFGPNAQAGLERDIQKLANQLRDAGRLDESSALLSSWHKGAGAASLRSMWGIASGQADSPGSTTLARIGATIRATETITSLGGVAVTSITDIPAIAATLAHEGVPFHRVVGNQVASLLPGDSAVRREVSTRMLAGVNGFMGGLYHRAGFDQGLPGLAGKAMDVFFRINLQNFWTDRMEDGITHILSNHVADNLRQPWSGMNARLRSGLERFGITEADWNAARGATLLTDRDGLSYFTPDMVDGAARQRFGAWFAETMDSALTRPGVYERAILTRGTNTGTWEGEFFRLATQFKAFPLTFITKHWTREIDRAASTSEAMGNITRLIAGATIFGMVSATLKDLMNGKNPRRPFDEREPFGSVSKYVANAMLRGGGGGIYGDFLFGDYNRFGGGFLETAMGPAAGTAGNLARLFTQIREGDDPRANAVNFAARDLLPTNIFYTKLAIDHMVIFRIQEWLNPGYLRRMERRVERENNQSFWLRPDAFQ